MMYKSSKGLVEISTMPLRYASNALGKLRREEPGRTEEIDALAKHCAILEAEASEDKPVAGLGDNNPPEEIKPNWEAVKAHMDDLLTEAANWADGAAVESQDQANQIGRLRQLLQDAANLADKARVIEKEPFDKAVAEIQDRYNAYTAPLKNKVPGSVSKAVLALGNLLAPWLRKLDDDRRARETAAREAAEAAQAAAIAARQDARQSGDLAEIDGAAALLDQAEEATRVLKAVEREKVQVAGAFRATGLRSTWAPVLRPGEGGKALMHYAKAQPDRVKAFLQQLAEEDVRRGVREIPGFNVNEERKVA